MNVQAFMAQAGLETRQLVRRWDVIFFSIVVPVAVMFFFGTMFSGQAAGSTQSRSMNDMLPGYIVMAVMSVGLASLGFMLSTERQFGILKRLGITPLTRQVLLLSKVAASLLIVVAATVVIMGMGVFYYGVDIRGSIFEIGLVIACGVMVFSIMGLMIAGVMKSDAAAATTNAVYLVMMVLGGTLFPLAQMPGFVQQIAQFTPSYHFMNALSGAMTKGSSMADLSFDLAGLDDMGRCLPGSGSTHIHLGIKKA